MAAAAWAATSRRTADSESDGAPTVSRQIRMITPITEPSRTTGSNSAERALVAATSGAARAGCSDASATK